MNNIILEAVNVCKTFSDGLASVSILHEINFAIRAGELISITGPSGCGKSTLLQILGGLDNPTSGMVKLNGKPFSSQSNNTKAFWRNAYIGFIYQFHHLLPEFNALENVAMPLLIRGESVRLATEKASVMLKKVMLSHRLTHKSSELSGGERQRVAIARALVTQPDIVLADEPTGNLDSNTAHHIFDLIQELNKSEGIAFIIVTHDDRISKKCNKNYNV